MPETFISIDNKLQKMVRLHNIDKLSHDSVVKPPFLHAKCNIWREPRFFFFFFFLSCEPVSVLSIFIVTAYDILRLTAKIELQI